MWTYAYCTRLHVLVYTTMAGPCVVYRSTLTRKPELNSHAAGAVEEEEVEGAAGVEVKNRVAGRRIAVVVESGGEGKGAVPEVEEEG